MSPIALLPLLVSIALNVYLSWLLRRKPPRPQSVELQEFLADLFTGKSGLGMVAVARVNQDDLLLRSPKR